MQTCYLLDIEISQCFHLLEKMQIEVTEYQQLDKKKSLEFNLKSLSPGNILVVEDINQLGKSFADTFNNLNYLAQAEVTLVSVKDEIKFSSQCPEYSFLFILNRVKKESDKKTVQSRLHTIKQKNSKVGRQSVYDEKTEAMINTLKEVPDLTVKQICQRVGISKSSYYSHYSKKRRNRFPIN